MVSKETSKERAVKATKKIEAKVDKLKEEVKGKDIGLPVVAKITKKKDKIHALDSKCKGATTDLYLGMAKSLIKLDKVNLCEKCMSEKKWADALENPPLLMTEDAKTEKIRIEMKKAKSERDLATEKKREAITKKRAEKEKEVTMAKVMENRKPGPEKAKSALDQLAEQPDFVTTDSLIEAKSSGGVKHRQMHKKGEHVNHAMGDHIDWMAGEDTPDEHQWGPAPFAAEMHTWFERLNDDLNLNLPKPVIGVKKMRKTKLATFLSRAKGDQVARNEVGLGYPIVFNNLYCFDYWVDNDGEYRWWVLKVLLHEAIHLWQEVTEGCEIPKSKASGHNKEFRKKMADLGILTNRKGITESVDEDGEFAGFLRKWDVAYDFDKLPTVDITRVKKYKWACGCAGGHGVRLEEGEAVDWTCNKCGKKFEMVD